MRKVTREGRAARWRGWVVRVVSVGLGCLAASGSIRSVRAQVRFEWPADVSVHLERYTTVDECLAVTGRVRDSLESTYPVWRDTMPMVPAEFRASLAEQVTSVAQRCSARFSAATAPLTDFAPLFTLYLLAGRDADAATLVTRRLKAVAGTAEHERAAVLDTIAHMYMGDGFSGIRSSRAQPARLAEGERFATELGKIAQASAPWQMRMGAYYYLMLSALVAGDTARAVRAAQQVIAINGTLTEADRRSGAANNAVLVAYNALGLLHGAELLDSLRRSTASYVAAQRSYWEKATGEHQRTLAFPIGQPAPPIEADFWFRRGEATTPRPAKGKVSLIVFFSGEESRCTNSIGCREPYAALHRLAQRFPELEITLVTETEGYLSKMVPGPPKVEADTLADWWLTKRQLPGALAVTATEFWRLPDPDRRRINRDVPNVLHYSFGRHWPVEPFGVYLVDRGGTIVDVLSLAARNEEVRLGQLLDAVFAQQTASR